VRAEWADNQPERVDPSRHHSEDTGMSQQHKRLGDMLIEANLITPDQLELAILQQKRSSTMLGVTLIQMGLVTEAQVLQTLHQQLGLPLIDLNDDCPDEDVVLKVKEEVARKYGAIPVRVEGRTLTVAMTDPLNVAALEDLRFHTGLFVRPVLASGSQISEAIDRFYNIDKSMKEALNNIISNDEGAVITDLPSIDEQQDEGSPELEGRPIVRLTNWILQRAVEARASDIHIEPMDRELCVRFRIDGLLHEEQRLPKWTQSALVSRFKVLSDLDIAEKRVPQDGRLRAEVSGRKIELRVSTLPISHGEKIVMRVVDHSRAIVSINDIGLYPDHLEQLKGYLDRPQGIILVTGPTGSGKSTILYSALRHVQHETKNIVTVEDPVELQIRGINQVQVDEKAKKTFPAALRAILRQDPDVIMVGEIRDAETAQIAFRASITGHLVLTTIHTNDAASAVTRLTDLGLEAFMVASALVGVVSIRLVRTLCPKCREPYEAEASTLGRAAINGGMAGTKVTLYRGRGCTNCHNTGFRGRTGIYEILEIDERLRQLVSQGATDAQIRQAAIENGMRSIGEDGLRKVLEGRTTMEEVTRVVYLAEHAPKVCPSCQTVLAKDYEYCTTCGEFVGDHCEGCHKRQMKEWTFCPFCGYDSQKPKRSNAHLVNPEEAGSTRAAKKPPRAQAA
jgi:type IV pilus assembly protein PilB